MTFLGIDLGTTNVKALVVDNQGTIVAQGSAPVTRTTTPDGGVEQDIDQIWEATCQAIREALGQTSAENVRCIGVSSQGGALQLLDAHDRPLGPVVSWLDGRGRSFDRQFEQRMGEDWLIAHTGHNLSSMALGQLLRLREESVETLAKAAGVGFVGDVIVGRLCGRRAHDATSLSIGMLYNPRLGDADPDLLQELRIQDKRLADLVSAQEPAGQLLDEAAEQTGLPKGIPVSAAIHDQYAASVGAGVVEEGAVLVGTGTAWVLLATMGHLAPPIAPRTFVCPHPFQGLYQPVENGDRHLTAKRIHRDSALSVRSQSPFSTGCYGQLLSLSNGGSAVQWVLEVTGQKGLSGEELDERLASVPPGADGLRCWPLLMDAGRSLGAMTPGGRLLGIKLGHSSVHLLRSVVEGLACELARHLDWFTAAGTPMKRLVVSGPAAVSSVVPQIVADVTDRPVTCLGQPEMSAFGAATIARTLAESGSDPRSLAATLAPAQRTVSPGENVGFYQDLFREYLAAFK